MVSWPKMYDKVIKYDSKYQFIRPHHCSISPSLAYLQASGAPAVLSARSSYKHTYIHAIIHKHTFDIMMTYAQPAVAVKSDIWLTLSLPWYQLTH